MLIRLHRFYRFYAGEVIHGTISIHGGLLGAVLAFLTPSGILLFTNPTPASVPLRQWVEVAVFGLSTLSAGLAAALVPDLQAMQRAFPNGCLTRQQLIAAFILWEWTTGFLLCAALNALFYCFATVSFARIGLYPFEIHQFGWLFCGMLYGTIAAGTLGSAFTSLVGAGLLVGAVFGWLAGYLGIACALAVSVIVILIRSFSGGPTALGDGFAAMSNLLPRRGNLAALFLRSIFCERIAWGLFLGLICVCGLSIFGFFQTMGLARLDRISVVEAFDRKLACICQGALCLSLLPSVFPTLYQRVYRCRGAWMFETGRLDAADWRELIGHYSNWCFWGILGAILILGAAITGEVPRFARLGMISAVFGTTVLQCTIKAVQGIPFRNANPLGIQEWLVTLIVAFGLVLLVAPILGIAFSAFSTNWAASLLTSACFLLVRLFAFRTRREY